MTKRPRPQSKVGWVCPACKMERGKDYHDPCLGKLPGVRDACCGHAGMGDTLGYIHFENGTVIRFGNLVVERA